MANSKDDVHDGTGRRTYYPGHGVLRGWPGRLSADYTGSGVPTNGIQGFAPGATYQNFLGAAGSAFYINVGTFASATWVELTGGGGFVSQTIAANTDDAYYFTDGTTKILSFDTRNTVTGVKALEITASPPTIVSASGDTFSQVYINAVTVTLTGTTTVTALEGIGLYLDIPTVTDASAATITTVSNLYVAAPAAAGGSATITNSYAAHFAGAIKLDGNVNTTAGTTSFLMKPNTLGSIAFSDGTTNMLLIDSRNTVTGVKAFALAASPPTITSATGDTFSQFYVSPVTVTLTGTTTVTALEGIGAYLDIPTVTDASAATITTVSNLYVAAPAAAGGSATITNSYAIHSAGALKIDGNINVAAQATTATIIAATAAALVVNDGTTSMISADTRTTVGTAGAGGTTLTGQPSVLTSAGSAFNTATLHLAARTNTLTGTTTTTSWLGSALYVEAQTWTDASACTLTTASAIHIVANAAAGGSLTITNSYMISTSVGGCFLTNAGVWTSTSTKAHKEEIEDVEAKDVFDVLDSVRARSYKWRKDHVEDYGRQRIGLIAEELPDALRIPGTTEQSGMPDGIAAGFAIAACKKLRDENVELKSRLARLEEAFAKLASK